jgi:hypothetical protein
MDVKGILVRSRLPIGALLPSAHGMIYVLVGVPLARALAFSDSI